VPPYGHLGKPKPNHPTLPLHVLLKWRRKQKVKVLKGPCCWAWGDAFEVLMMSGTEAITRVLFLAGVFISGACSVSQAQIVPSSAGPLKQDAFSLGHILSF